MKKPRGSMANANQGALYDQPENKINAAIYSPF